ncbi:MAG: hypothetical protein KA369_11385 [Spirochaetes bacterium]|nr:hypothetical protein [Spirochaetota bacterium]
MKNKIVALMAVLIALHCAACGKMEEKKLEVNPLHVMKLYLEKWKKNDWKALYAMTDPSFMQKLRTQKLSPELQRLSDQDLFVHEFQQARRLNPAKVLKSYEIISITPYNKGDTTLWGDVVINGKKRRIPLTLDGLSLKVDLTRIE